MPRTLAVFRRVFSKLRKREAAVALISAALLVLAYLRKRRQHRIELPCQSKPVLVFPAALVKALRENNALVLLDQQFFFDSELSTLKQILFRAVGELSAKGGDTYTTCLEALLEPLNSVNSSKTEAELILGDICAVAGVKEVWNAVSRVMRTYSSHSTHRNVIIRRLEAVAAVPFVAVLSVCWGNVVENIFPHLVGRNFGGYATILAKPRVDAPPGPSRPILHLWPGLLRLSNQRTKGGGESGYDHLPASRSECAQILDRNGPYVQFLRDVFSTKVVVIAGLSMLPPCGHVGDALHEAWRIRQLQGGDQPLAYTFAPGATEAECDHCIREYGLCVITFKQQPHRDLTMEYTLHSLRAAYEHRDDVST